MTTDNLKAGPELDRLVAQKVMGWEYVIDGEGTGWVDKATEQFVTGYNNDDPSQPEILPPPFSTSIAAAMEVANKFTTKTFYYDDATCTWFVGLHGGCKPHEDCKWQAAAEDLPHAICLAAMAWADK